MPYQAIHIPFADGQNEGFDRKILPVGPMRSVMNMWLERDGRMARRPRLVGKTVDNVDGDDARVDAVLGFTRRGFVGVEENTGDVICHAWARTSDGDGRY